MYVLFCFVLFCPVTLESHISVRAREIHVSGKASSTRLGSTTIVYEGSFSRREMYPSHSRLTSVVKPKNQHVQSPMCAKSRSPPMSSHDVLPLSFQSTNQHVFLVYSRVNPPHSPLQTSAPQHPTKGSRSKRTRRSSITIIGIQRESALLYGPRVSRRTPEERSVHKSKRDL